MADVQLCRGDMLDWPDCMCDDPLGVVFGPLCTAAVLPGPLCKAASPFDSFDIVVGPLDSAAVPLDLLCVVVGPLVTAAVSLCPLSPIFLSFAAVVHDVPLSAVFLLLGTALIPVTPSDVLVCP